VKLAPFPEPAFDPVPILNIIGQLEWRQARKKDRWGHPQIPHAYVVRGRPPGNEELYVALFHQIQQRGREERFGRARRQYLYPGDGFKYWAMTTDFAESRVLNRMLVEDDLDRMRATGQIE
jgi:hypothetical protein